MRLRADMRAQWRAWVSLALIAGIAAGCSIAAAAGARRTNSAYPRFLRAQDAFHAVTGGGAEQDWEAHVQAIKALPEVKDWVDIRIVGGEMTLPARRGRPDRVLAFPDSFISVDPSGRAGYETDRAKILAGRFADRSAVNEVMVPWGLAERHDIRVGDEIVAGVGFDPETRKSVERVAVTVVGIEAAPGEFEAVGQIVFMSFRVTPALFEKYQEMIPNIPDLSSLGVHLHGGASAAYAFKQKVESDFEIDVPMIEPVVRSGVQKTMGLYAAAFWLVALFVAIAGLAIIGQTLARQISLDASDFPVLRGMGVTRNELFALGFIRAAAVGLLSAPIAVAIAFMISPLTPIGAARIAEPDPGFAFDGTVIGTGVALLVVSLLAVALWPAFRAARLAGLADREDLGERPSRIASWAGSRSAVVAAGLRMALERGRGRTAVPVRSTILSVAIGIAAMTATLVAGSSLVNLIDTPALGGLTYDAIIPNDEDNRQAAPESQDENHRLLRAFPFMDATAEGTGLNINIKGIDSFLVALRSADPIGFAIIRGRAPGPGLVDGLPEIAVGPATLRRVGLRIGDQIEFFHPVGDDGEEHRVSQRAHIVGTAAIPPLPWAAIEPGEGAVMALEGVRAFTDDSGGCCFVRFKKGTDLAAARTALEDKGFETFVRTSRADLVTLERITTLPIALTAIFGLMALAALAHVLVTGIRRRRRDLALLKTLGFVDRQIRGAIAWQASAMVMLSVLVGVPAGIALGRWGWQAIADQFGVVAVPVMPVWFIAIILPAALLLANVLAVVPGRAAARTQAAVVLRAE